MPKYYLRSGGSISIYRPIAKAKRSTEAGATAVEFSLAVPVLLTLIMGLIGISLAAINIISINVALHHAAQFASLGITFPGMDRDLSVKQVLEESLNDFGVGIAAGTISMCPIGSNCTSLNPGGPNERVRIGVEVPMTLLIPGSEMLISRSVVFRNEPF